MQNKTTRSKRSSDCTLKFFCKNFLQKLKHNVKNFG